MSPDGQGLYGAGQYHPDTEVAAKASRRKFSMAYKRRIVADADACEGTGDIGALLRREGLYYSTLSKFREQVARRDTEIADSASARKRLDCTMRHETYEAYTRLKRENSRLKRKLAQAEAVIEVQKKVSELMGIALGPDEDSQ